MVEIAVTVAILGVTAAMAVGTMRGTLPSWRTRSVANEFISQVNHARMRAISDGREFRIQLDTYDPDIDGNGPSMGKYLVQGGDAASGSTTWNTLPIETGSEPDADYEGTFEFSEGTENGVKGVSLSDWGTLSGAYGNSGTITFDTRGWVENPSSDFACDVDGNGSPDGYICVDFVNKVQRLAGVDDTYRVIISKAGMARLSTVASTDFPSGQVGT
jgi:type II secretory pathway pseudopilin PulG